MTPHRLPPRRRRQGRDQHHLEVRLLRHGRRGEESREYANDLNINNLQDALIVDGDPNDPSTWHCRSGNAGCVPWNLFKVGGVTQAALDYLSLAEIQNTGTKTQLVHGEMNADLKNYGLVIPSAVEGIQLAVGAEYRKEFLFVHPDLAFLIPLRCGPGGPTTAGRRQLPVKEGFTEVRVPLVQGVRGAKNLVLDLAYRYSDYNTNGGYSTYKAEFEYSPTADLKLRGGYNRATRAPNVQELFMPQCMNAQRHARPLRRRRTRNTRRRSARSPACSAAQYGHILENPARQYNDLDGGNPNLTPEIADTKTFGLVITPAAISRPSPPRSTTTTSRSRT